MTRIRSTTYFTAATQAALVLAEFRAPFRGRATPVNAWWGTFDLAVPFFSGKPADPPGDDFITAKRGRRGSDPDRLVARRPKHDGAAFFAFAHPAPEGFAEADLDPEAAHWDTDLGEFALDWEDIRSAEDPHALALEFAHSAFGHACDVCAWDPVLAESAQGKPPPIH